MNIHSYFTAKPRRGVYVAIAAATLLASGLLVWYIFSKNTTVILILNYLAKLLMLLIGLAGLGAAYSALAVKDRGGIVGAFAVSTGAYLFVQLVAAVCAALAYVKYDLGTALAVEIGAAFTNMFFQFLLYATVFLFVFLVAFFRKKAPDAPVLFGLQNRYALANLLSVGLLFVFQLGELIAESVKFIMDYAPNIYPNEIATMIFDFVFLFLSMLIGYVLLYAVELFSSADRETA